MGSSKAIGDCYIYLAWGLRNLITATPLAVARDALIERDGVSRNQYNETRVDNGGHLAWDLPKLKQH